MNALIEIGEHVITREKLGFPSTYREIFEILKNEGIISDEVFKLCQETRLFKKSDRS
ncbi:MAG: HepT-like ribonuclease domain-containing protein [Candidatus Freyrarchaeum guaymaensis]